VSQIKLQNVLKHNKKGEHLNATALPAQRFYAAPFAIDGEMLGLGAWQISALSPRWINFARDLLQEGGSTFHRSLPPPFERVHLRFTSASDAALATFSLDTVVTASSAYLRGEDLTSEQQLLEMFVQSARKADIVRKVQTTSEPFAKVFSIRERPLHVVIVWGASMHDQDAECIAQLATHFAAAFLCAPKAL
jgi:hypothetical protein